MVVAFDLERDRLALAEVDDAGVLARSLEDARRVGGEALQQPRGVLVRTVFRPEQREDGELEMVGLAAEQFADSVELPVREAEGAVERLFCDPRQVLESSCGSGRAAFLNYGTAILLPAASLSSKSAPVGVGFAPNL
jgi:hypothetical protein